MDTYGFKIKRLTVDSPNRTEYRIGEGFVNSKEINKIEKPGEMAMVPWYQVIGNDGTIREVNGKYIIEIFHK